MIGGKWTVLVLCCLQHGPVRTGALTSMIEGISAKVLTQTLRDLEGHGIIERVSYPEVPPRVEYRLTEIGISLSRLAVSIEQWAVSHYAGILAHRALKRDKRSGGNP